MSKHAENIEQARREYVAALGTKHEQHARKKLEWAVEAARKESK